MTGKKIAKGKGYLHSNEDKSRGVAAYVTTGSFTKAAAITGIAETTLRYWAKQDWFAEEAKRVDRQDTEELKAVFTRISKKASSELEDRLERGDEVIGKDGEIILKKIPGKELAIIAAVAADKRKMQMEIPQTVAIQNSQEKLLSLMESFMRFASAKEIKQEKADENILDMVDESSIESERHPGHASPIYDASPSSSDPTGHTA